MRDIGKFFKALWKGILTVKSVITTIVFYAFLFWLGLVLFSDPIPNIPDKGALVIEPVGFIVEQRSEKDTLEILFPDETRQVPETLLRDIATAIRHAKTDERITSLVLNMDYLFGAGLAQLHYIGQLVDDFKRSGKPVYAYGLGFSGGQYLVASFADEIYMHPMGSVILTGYGSYPLYYREAIEKIKAKVHVFRAGTYKSFSEPYTRDSMSEEAKEANLALVTSLWQDFAAQVSASRGISPEALDASYGTLPEDLAAHGGDLALLAQDQGFVDGLMRESEWESYMAGIAGENGSYYGYSATSFSNYLLATEADRLGSGDQVAVVTVSGEIILGESRPGQAGAFTVIRHLQTARYDDRVKAVVLRIDSPGGGMLASELIREEVELLKEAGKPVIVSMGAVAASGGYYIAAPADEIWAQPTTITGSIGVIGMVPTFEGSLDAIGIHSDGVGTTPLSGDFAFGRPLSPLAVELFQQSVENSYSQFIEMVAENRSLTPEDVDAVGQGRVWTGTAAQSFGLVDNLGNFEDAVAAAAFNANLSTFTTHFIEEESDFSKGLVEWFFAKTGAETFQVREAPSLAKILLHDLEKAFNALSAFNDPGSVYVLCENCEVR